MENQHWPSWRYGPGGAAGVFASAGEVPAGWKDHPSKVEAKTASPHTPPVSVPSGAVPAIDADGWPLDPTMHTGTLTKAGLWRMKVGASRPAPKPGFPKPALDL